MRLPKYKYLLAIVDFCTILTTFYLARSIAISIFGTLPDKGFFHFHGISYSFILSSLIFTCIFIFIFQSNNLYKINIFLSSSAHLVNILRAIIQCAILLIVSSFVFKISHVIESRILVMTFTSTLILTVPLIRLFLLPMFYKQFKKSKLFTRNLIIIGAGKAGKLLGTKIVFEVVSGLKLVGYLDDNCNVGEEILLGYKNLGNIDEIKKISKKYQVNEIIISIDNVSYDKLLAIMDKCNEAGLIVRLNSELFKIIPEKFDTDFYAKVNVIEISPRINGSFNFLFKRIFDFCVTLNAIVFLLPVFFLIAILIKITSEGPVIYSHYRVGKNGKLFKFYKFRSMKLDRKDDTERRARMIEFMRTKEKNINGDTKIVNESRVTRIGKIIRKTSLDELPQLFNVLIGDMSLVGPRPCLPYEYENYDDWQKRRVSILPGCTGVWQVSGRSNVSFTDSVVMDIYYINHMSPWFDLQLILKTIPVMAFGRGGK